MIALPDAARGAAAAAWRAFESLALPQRCAGCGAPLDPARVLCGACEDAIPKLGFSACVRCLARGAEALRCARHPNHRAWSAWIYDERAERAVHALKFGARRAQAASLGARIAAALPRELRPDVVVALPLHPARRRERGYSQTDLLADAVARTLGAPLVAGAIERARHTPPQTGLDAAARRANVRGAFRVVRPEVLRGRAVLLVDDVLTTGATLDAALTALSRARARAFAATLAWAA